MKAKKKNQWNGMEWNAKATVRIRNQEHGREEMYMAMVHLEAPVLNPAVAIDVKGLNGELGHLVLGLAFVVGQQPGLQHEVAHVDE